MRWLRFSIVAAIVSVADSWCPSFRPGARRRSFSTREVGTRQLIARGVGPRYIVDGTPSVRHRAVRFRLEKTNRSRSGLARPSSLGRDVVNLSPRTAQSNYYRHLRACCLIPRCRRCHCKGCSSIQTPFRVSMAGSLVLISSEGLAPVRNPPSYY